MFGTLLESMARHERRAGGSAASIAAHAALIGGAVLATTQGPKLAIPSTPPGDTVRWTLVKPPPANAPPRVVDASVTSVPTPLALRVPSIIPTEIPTVDFSAAPTTTLSYDGPGQRGGTPCRGLCVSSDSSGTSPMWVGNEAIMQLKDRVVPPRYPEALRAAGVDGRVVVRFVVDTLGRVDPASVEIVESSHALFTAAVRETLSKLRFTPAVAGSRKVAAAAVMPFEFRLK